MILLHGQYQDNEENKMNVVQIQVYKKFSPEVDGVFFCPEKDCKFSLDKKSLEEGDKKKIIPWFHVNKTGNLVVPGCPTHGRPLTFSTDNPNWSVEDDNDMLFAYG
jgi:hypothetical protein